ncbi:MAG: helix-turn-helix transcriptional regulator [Phreatobacter sp.]|uniref:winged helix-turn-helix transcriptional regulator n=1 Tax=Phreatobacter sp. TaxID=1966341 RepID=UPI001A58A3C6|nr:helix-turn-helix domain-containing protein [Phreatobacter sp.]MBL8568198.1 helix-turn-helix transcriptional regulator [Phreatobacter sp.]
MDALLALRGLDEPSPRRAADCPVEDWLAFLGHRWNALALWHLKAGPKRHGALMRDLPGITPKVLAERLTGLEGRGLIARRDLRGYPRGVSYELTARGRDLVAILDRLELWARAGEPPH